jgi:hypothetical protein
MSSLPKQERVRALQALGVWCQMELTGTEPPKAVLESLNFKSVDGMKIQLNNWGLPKSLTHPDRGTEKPKPPKPPPPEREARSSGPVTELPPASNAMPLFAEKLKALAYGNEDLVHRKEKLQGGLFAQSAIYTDPAYVPRHNYSDEEWKDLCELYDLDPEDTGFWETDKKSWSLGRGTWAPQEPLPALIATYVLMEGEIEPLLEALYPGTPTEEVVEKIRKRIEGKKGTDGQDGLKVLARQLARLVRGGNVGRGAHPPDISPHEFNVACRITQLREEGWSDEDIYQRLCESQGFARVLSSSQRLSPVENFQRLADLEVRYPFS